MSLLADLLYLFLYFFARYRRRIVRSNLASAFPDRPTEELRRIERTYYLHLADLLVEGIHNLFASPRSVLRRYRVTNPRLLDPYFDSGTSVILLSAHYNNWEYMVTSLGLQFHHHGIGVGKPLSNRLLEPWVFRRRTRFATQVVYADTVRQTVEFYHRHRVPCALMMLSDQSPPHPDRAYWTHFLHHDTAFLYGAENFARKYNLPVFYYSVSKTSRHHYQVTLHPLCLNPAAVPQYTIVEQYARTLEKQISLQPEYWLWSHRRWKHQRPAT